MARTTGRLTNGAPIIRSSSPSPLEPYWPEQPASDNAWVRIEVWEQVEVAAVVGAVMQSAQRDATHGLAASAARPRHEMRRVDSLVGAADDAAPSGDRGALGVG